MPPLNREGYWSRLAALQAEAEQGPSLDRRRALKLLAASMALAAAPGCSRREPEHILPYVNAPENQVAGVPRYFATSIPVAGYAHGVLAECYEGRPIKLEGNPEHPATRGACDAISQAAVLSLYDPQRSTAIRHNGAVSEFGRFVNELKKQRRQWDASGGRGLALLRAEQRSPSEQALENKISQRWPHAQWFRHEPVSRESLYQATEAVFGRRLAPRYRFDQAERVLSLDADFLQGQPGAIRYCRDFSSRRQSDNSSEAMARLYVIESSPTVTGAVADHRLGLEYHALTGAALQLAAALGMIEERVPAVLPTEWLNTLAQDLLRSGERSLVVAGEQQPPLVQALAFSMNRFLNSSAIEYFEGQSIPPPERGLTELVGQIEAGAVDALISVDCNPVYSSPGDLALQETLQRIGWHVHFGDAFDETAEQAHWHIPASHPLESWGDLWAFDGSVSLSQPVIESLYSTRTSLQFLTLVESGRREPALNLLKSHWRLWWQKQPVLHRNDGGDFEKFWQRNLQRGWMPETRPAPVHRRANTPAQILARFPGSESAAEDNDSADDEVKLHLRPEPFLWDGRYATNLWLQETPRPLTSLTWENALIVSHSLAEKMNLSAGDLVSLTTSLERVDVPVLPLDRQPEGCATLYLGYGRSRGHSLIEGAGVNAYRLQNAEHHWAVKAKLKPTGKHRTLPRTQQHDSSEGRDMIRAATLATYQHNATFAQEEHHRESLLDETPIASDRPGPQWGMAIDLSACIGCNACITACQAENNTPVVGAEEVAQGREMHWLRVDHYREPAGVGIEGLVFQPVPCMHCENAPCEYVCPVGATQHSADGLNEMIYQRCVGTRYCSQNCPYKVRRFNWRDYTGNAAFYPAAPARQNPEVTIRSRGVMEKCTYCVQRIRQGSQRAENAGRALADGEVQTACQQACPTRAITFGDLSNAASRVSEQQAGVRNYRLFEHLNTRPRTSYLAAVRNPHERLAKKGGGDG